MAAWEYDNFDLLIETEGEGCYRARVVDSPAGESPDHVFRIPFELTHLENLLLKLDPGRSGTRRVAGDPQSQAAVDLGSGLFESVFSSELRLTWARSMDSARAARRGLRLRLRLTEVPELAALPWELLYDHRQASYIAQSERTPVVRYLDVPLTTRPLDIDGALRILVVLSSPTDLPDLDVEGEWRGIKNSLAQRVADGTVRIDRLPEPTLQSLSAWIRRHDVHVIHFVGHGEFDRQLENGVLYFSDRYGRRAPVSAGSLGPYLRDHDPLRLVFLNACQSARLHGSDPFSGLAQGLVQQGCVAVVAMQFPISDGAAAEFTGEFYGSLADGYAVDQSVTSARKALLAGYASEWATPVLFLRDSRGRVFEHIHPDAGLRSSPVEPAERTERAVVPAAPVVTAGAGGVAVAGRAGVAPTATDVASPMPSEASSGVLTALRTPTASETTEATRPATDARVAAKETTAVPPPTPSTPSTVRLPRAPSVPERTGRAAGRILAIVLVIALLGGLGWWFRQRVSPDDGTTSNLTPVVTTSAETTKSDPTTTSEAPPVVTTHVTVQGDLAWTDTGLQCEPGKRYQIVATGSVAHAGKNAGVGPDGDPNPSLRQFNAPGLPKANHSALIASVDKKAPPTVVGSSTTYQCQTTGGLYLGPNDSGLDNNSGEWDVTLTPSR